MRGRAATLLLRAALLALIACVLLHPPTDAQDNHTRTGTIRTLDVSSRWVPARTVFVYLPPGYDLPRNRKRRYPVFYLHDGQNVFDAATSFLRGHEWHADETAERLIRAGEIEPLILVAVPNAGAARTTEYTPSRDPKYGGGGADAYERFLRWELKPFVDRAFRTQPGPENTGIGGASLGALVSLDAGLRHPDTFRRIAVLSPSVWWNDKAVLSQVATVEKRPSLRIYLDVGTQEPGDTLPNARLLRDALLRAGWTADKNLRYREGDGDAHNEDAWAKRFPDALRFLFPAR